MTVIGATSPFAQASLNDRLPHPYLPVVRGDKGSGVACAIVVLKGEAITYASRNANELANDAVFCPPRCQL